MPLQRREILPHPLQCLIQILHGGRIGEPYMLGRPEALARDGGHVRLVQQAVRNIGAALDPTLSKECRNIWICIERTLRHLALDSGDRLQSRDNVIA